MINWARAVRMIAGERNRQKREHDRKYGTGHERVLASWGERYEIDGLCYEFAGKLDCLGRCLRDVAMLTAYEGVVRGIVNSKECV